MTARIEAPAPANGRRRTALSVLLGSGGIALVCVALAAPVFAYAARAPHDVGVPTNGVAAATAVCPKGYHVGFGGVVGGIQLAFPQYRVLPEGMRLTASNKWTAYAKGFSPSGHLKAVAYCVHGSTGLRVASKSAAVARAKIGTVIATCPVGTVAVAGGYNSGTGRRNLESLRRMERIGTRQWVVTIHNGGLATTVSAYGYCAGGTAPTLVTATVKVTRYGYLTARVNCPKGTSLVGGGVTSGGLYGSLDVFSMTAPSSTQWVVKAFNAGNQGTFTAEAYCR